MTQSVQLTVIFVLVVLTFLAMASVRLRLAGVERQVRQLSRVDAKLDLLLKQAGLVYDPYRNLPSEVAAAIARGEKIEAIKLYRKASGVGLKEAKDFIEDIQRGSGV